MKKQLIINADDFGIHEAVNLAVYRGFESGILTSTSIMAGGDAFSSAVRLSREMGNIGIGIHLTLVGTLTTVLPAEEVPTLTWEKGVLCKDYLELILRDMKGLISLDDVYREWDAQIRKVLDAGISITHIDGHQHLHMWNKFFPIALALGKKYKIPCMRVPDESFFFDISAKNILRSMAGTGLAFIARRHRSVLKQMNVKTNDYFYGMLYGGHLTEDRIINLLSRVKSGVTEIMCHPSSNEQEMDRQLRWGYHGESEAIKKTIRIKESLKNGRVKTINEALSAMNISRSAYYKYKDHVEPVTGAVKERSITYFIMMQNDFSLLNKIMRKIKKENNDVLSINSGVAFGENVPTIISFKTKMTLADINLLAESIRRIKGIIRIVVSEEEGSR